MGRSSRLDEAKKARERSESEKGGGVNIEWLHLAREEWKVFRMLGNTPELRREPSDWKIIQTSMIKGDDDKFFGVVWSDDSTWPLRKLFNFIAKYKWDATMNNGTGGKAYEHNQCELLNRVLTNGQTNKNASGWQPSKKVVGNVIDRMDTWCVDNKHAKLISWGANPSSDGSKTYPTPGISNGMFKHIFDVVCDENGDYFDEFDLAVMRYKEKVGNDWYVARHGVEDAKKKGGEIFTEFVTEGYLTEEEKGYELYDVDDIPFITRPTNIKTIRTKLDHFIKQVDVKYNTNFMDEFKALEEKEAKAYAERMGNNANTVTTAPVDEPKSEPVGRTPREPIGSIETNPATEATTPSETVFDVNTLDPNIYEGIASMGVTEKELIIGVDKSSGNLIYVNANVAPCHTCKKDFHDNMTFCPYCNTAY